MPAAKPFTDHDGTVWKSQRAAAAARGVHGCTIARNLEAHGSTARMGGPKPGVPVRDSKGKVYPSKCAAARALKCHHQTVEDHLNKYGDISRLEPDLIVYFDRTWTDPKKAARSLGVTQRTIAKHMGKHGNLNRMIVGKRPRWTRTTAVCGVVFASRGAACKALGISDNTLRLWNSVRATKKQRLKLLDTVIAYKMKESGSVSQMSD